MNTENDNKMDSPVLEPEKTILKNRKQRRAEAKMFKKWMKKTYGKFLLEQKKGLQNHLGFTNGDAMPVEIAAEISEAYDSLGTAIEETESVDTLKMTDAQSTKQDQSTVELTKDMNHSPIDSQEKNTIQLTKKLASN